MTLSHRIKTIFSHIDEPVDTILIKNGSAPFIDSTFFYVTGISQGLFEGCTALLFPSGSLRLLVSSLEKPLVPHSLPIETYSSKQEYAEKLQDMIGNINCLGINTACLLYDDYTDLQDILPNSHFISISQAIKAARIIKDVEELSHIREACCIADQVMAKIPSFFSSPLTEYQLASEIDHQLKQLGASSPAFDTISSFGPNTAKPHYANGKREIQSGDFILCDFGATINHYHSDITRTFTYGPASQKQKRMHQTVLTAQQQALQSITPGTVAKSVHQITKESIDTSEFKGYFIHSTGHSLGLEVHDVGIGFADSYENTLQPGMVFTVEPGIYIPEIGGVRIEDDIVVTPDGYIQLTSSIKDLIEIPPV